MKFNAKCTIVAAFVLSAANIKFILLDFPLCGFFQGRTSKNHGVYLSYLLLLLVFFCCKTHLVFVFQLSSCMEMCANYLHVMWMLVQV